MSVATDLDTTLEQLADQIKDLTVSPKPTYTIAGRSISWGEHFNNLMTAMEKVRVLRQQADGPFEVRTRVV